MIFFRKLKSFFGNFFKEEKFLFRLSCATVGIIILFGNYIPTFLTTKNPIFMNYGFNSVMNFILLIT